MTPSDTSLTSPLADATSPSPEAVPVISIVIPAHNAAATLATTLTSLVAQTYLSWEAIIVDDGSTDSSHELAREFAVRDPRFRVVVQANAGAAAARNTGIAKARSGWLMFLDADDWIAPSHLERMMAALYSNSDLDAVHCGYARVASDGSHVPDTYQAPTGDLFPVLARRSAFPIHACVVRKSLVDVVGRCDRSLKTCSDWDLWQRIARTGARFGAVNEILAFYRMSQASVSSLDPYQLFRDDLRVLRQGHSPDPRVPNPLPEHLHGEPQDQMQSQVFYLLSWCAGLLLGRGEDPRPLFELAGSYRAVELFPDAIARCIFDSAILPHSQSPSRWQEVWPRVRRHLDDFLLALESRSTTPDFAQRTVAILKRLILVSSPDWSSVVEELETGTRLAEREIDKFRRLAEDCDRAAQASERESHNWRRLAEDRERALVDLEQASRVSERDLQRLQGQIDLLTKERNEALYSYERRFGDLLLNRLRLCTPLLATENAVANVHQRLTLARLAAEAGLRRDPSKIRVMATACDLFPIYSHTFVYQELLSLARAGFCLRFVYSRLASRDHLSPEFDGLWDVKRRLFLCRRVHEKDFARYHSRIPTKVETLIEKLCEASGMTRRDLLLHDNFLQAFSFARMVEAFNPHYLHSYFFYDRSLMALVASYLLDVPRGISCYADHLLNDYELKVVRLHLELCSVIVATSARIKGELLGIAPHVDPNRILVKPNGIDTTWFPVLPRTEPATGEPFRLVSVCRIDPKKGLLDLVDSVKLLRERGLNVEAHIVGAVDEWNDASRDYKRRLDQRITESNLWGRIHLEGRQNLAGVRRLLGVGHLFVAPFVETDTGDKDGIPTALLEAMSTGIASVATDAGSITEVIHDGRDGVIVPQRDSTALANAIESLLSDPSRRQQLGETAARFVRSSYDAAESEKDFHLRLRTVAGCHLPARAPMQAVT